MAAFSILPKVQDCIRMPWRISIMFFSKIKIVEKFDVPKKPKKPPTPFQLFKSEVAEELKKERPEIETNEITCVAKDLWNKKSAEEKSKYHSSYNNFLEEYKKNMTSYLHQEDLYTTYKKKTREKKVEKIIQEKRLSDLKKPKQPLPPFFKFLSLHRNEVSDRSVESNKEYATKMGKKWKEMTDAEKEKFRILYSEERKEYEKSLTKWEEEMIDLGNLDVIRVSTLQKLNTKS